MADYRQWNPITINHQASTQMRDSAVAGVGQLSKDFTDQLRYEKEKATEEARYQTEQARQQVLDARATTLYDQQQKERADLIAMKTAVGQGLVGVPEDALTMGQPTTVQGTQMSPQETYMTQGRNVVVPGTSGREVVTSTTPGGYTNPNPTIAFDRNQIVTRTEKLPSKVEPVFKDISKYADIGLPQLAINSIYSSIAPDPAKAKLLDTPGMYTSIPGSSAKKLNAAGEEALKKGSMTTTERKVTPTTTTLNDVDLTKVYNAQGKPIGTKDAGDGKNAYYRTKVEGALVNAMAVGKGAMTKENSYVQGKSEKTYVPGTPGYTKYISGTSNKEYIGSNGTTVPVKDVVGSVQGSMSSYQDVIDKMGKGTTAEKITKISNDITRDVLKAHPELAHMAIDIQEMAKKGVGLKLPDGSLTKTEELKLVAAGEDLKHQYDVQKENRGYDQAWRLQQSSQNFQAGQKALDRRDAKENAKSNDWYTKAKMLGLLSQELSKTDPTKIAEREKEKIKDQIAAKDREGDRFAKYLSTVGTGTDAYSYQQWKAAGMPVASDPNYAKPWGTW